MKAALIVLAIWAVVSLPVGIFIGRYIKAGRRSWPGEQPPEY